MNKLAKLGAGAAMLAGQVLMGCGGGSPTETKGSARESGNFFTADGDSQWQATDCGGNELAVNVRPPFTTVNYTVECDGIKYSYDAISGPLDARNDQLHIGISEGCKVVRAGVQDALQTPPSFDANSCFVKEGVYNLLHCVRGASENTSDVNVLLDGSIAPYGKLPDSVCEKPQPATVTTTTTAPTTTTTLPAACITTTKCLSDLGGGVVTDASGKFCDTDFDGNRSAGEKCVQ